MSKQKLSEITIETQFFEAELRKEAVLRAFGGIRKHFSHAEILCRSCEPENDGAARP